MSFLNNKTSLNRCLKVLLLQSSDTAIGSTGLGLLSSIIATDCCGVVSSLVSTLRIKETVGELVAGTALKFFSLDEISLRLNTVIDWGMLIVAGTMGWTTGRSDRTLGLLNVVVLSIVMRERASLSFWFAGWEMSCLV